MPSKIMTIEEVAKTMKVSLKTVYRWIDAGRFPASRIGDRTYRIFERDFIKFVKNKKVKK